MSSKKKKKDQLLEDAIFDSAARNDSQSRLLDSMSVADAESQLDTMDFMRGYFFDSTIQRINDDH